MTTRTDPNTIPDEVADAAQIEHHEFIFGWDEPVPTRRHLGIARQAWKCAIAVALDKMRDTGYTEGNNETTEV